MNSRMADQSLASELKHLFNLWLAWNHQRRGRLRSARLRLDKSLSLVRTSPSYLVAFDAALMIREDRHEEAQRRLRECIATLPEELTSEEKYVSVFCAFWLSMYDVDCAYREIEEQWENVATLSVDGLPKHFLRIPSKDQLRARFGNREASSPSPATQSSMAVSYGAGF